MYLKFLLALHSNANPQHIRKSFENVEYRRASERAKERATSRLEVPAWTMAISLAPPSVQWAYPGAFAQRLPVRTLASQRVGVAREQRRRGEQVPGRSETGLYAERWPERDDTKQNGCYHAYVADRWRQSMLHRHLGPLSRFALCRYLSHFSQNVWRALQNDSIFGLVGLSEAPLRRTRSSQKQSENRKKLLGHSGLVGAFPFGNFSLREHGKNNKEHTINNNNKERRN